MHTLPKALAQRFKTARSQLAANPDFGRAARLQLVGSLPGSAA